MTKDIDAAMNSMPPGWKSRWCNSHMCACMGCANKSGGLTAKGYTYEDWRDWISRNKEDYMNGLSPIKEVKWSMEPKEMTNQKNNLVWEIQDLQLDIDEHTRKINELKTRLEQKQQQLNEIPITLERIIIECMLSYNNEVRLEILENILDRVEVEFLSHKVVMDEHEPIVDVVEYHRGWDNCLKELKGRLRE